MSSVRVCACVCYKCVQAHVCEHARARLRYERVYISVFARVFFFFLLSFFPLIIKVYFILQSLECAGNRQCSLFFFPLSLFLSSLSLLSSNRLALSFAFQERISTINRVRGNEETFSDFFQGFPTTDYAKIRDRWIYRVIRISKVSVDFGVFWSFFFRKSRRKLFLILSYIIWNLTRKSRRRNYLDAIEKICTIIS